MDTPLVFLFYFTILSSPAIAAPSKLTNNPDTPVATVPSGDSIPKNNTRVREQRSRFIPVKDDTLGKFLPAVECYPLSELLPPNASSWSYKEKFAFVINREVRFDKLEEQWRLEGSKLGEYFKEKMDRARAKAVAMTREHPDMDGLAMGHIFPDDCFPMALLLPKTASSWSYWQKYHYVSSREWIHFYLEDMEDKLSSSLAITKLISA